MHEVEVLELRGEVLHGGLAPLEEEADADGDQVARADRAVGVDPGDEPRLVRERAQQPLAAPHL